jgi:hypothetical protein
VIEQNWLPSESSLFATGQCAHDYWRKCGHWSNRQRWRCVCCGKERLEGAKQIMPIQERAILLLPAFRKGWTILQTAHEHQLSHNTVRLAFNEILKHIERPTCACGRKGGHLGQCKFVPRRAA